MKRQLPPHPDLDQLKTEANDLLKAYKAGAQEAIRRIKEGHSRWSNATDSDIRAGKFGLSSAQAVVAREYGFASWPKLKEHVGSTAHASGDPVEQIKQAYRADDAALVSQLLEVHPELKAMINEPVGPFDTQPIVNARSRHMVDVLLAAGADINAKSRWWAGGFGILDGASPEL